MKIKVNEATELQLDWMVAKTLVTDACIFKIRGGKVLDRLGLQWAPTTNWSQGGPIIEREGIDILKLRTEQEGWRAYHTPTPEAKTHCFAEGPTPLVAAMRCYVVSKLGDEVEVPEALA